MKNNTTEVMKSLNTDGSERAGVMPKVGEVFKSWGKLAEAMGEKAAPGKGREFQEAKFRKIISWEKASVGRGYIITSVHPESDGFASIEEFSSIAGKKLTDLRLGLLFEFLARNANALDDAPQTVAVYTQDVQKIIGLANGMITAGGRKGESEKAFLSEVSQENGKIVDYLMVKARKLEFMVVRESWVVSARGANIAKLGSDLVGKKECQDYILLDDSQIVLIGEVYHKTCLEMGAMSVQELYLQGRLERYYLNCKNRLLAEYGIYSCYKVTTFTFTYSVLENYITKSFQRLSQLLTIKNYSNRQNIDKLLKMFSKIYTDWQVIQQQKAVNAKKDILQREDFQQLSNVKLHSKAELLQPATVGHLMDVYIKL